MKVLECWHSLPTKEVFIICSIFRHYTFRHPSNTKVMQSMELRTGLIKTFLFFIFVVYVYKPHEYVIDHIKKIPAWLCLFLDIGQFFRCVYKSSIMQANNDKSECVVNTLYLIFYVHINQSIGNSDWRRRLLCWNFICPRLEVLLFSHFRFCFLYI